MPTAATSTRCIPEVPSSCPPGSHSRPKNPAELKPRAERPCPARKPPPSGPQPTTIQKMPRSFPRIPYARSIQPCLDPSCPSTRDKTIGDQHGPASQEPPRCTPGVAWRAYDGLELGDVTANAPIWPIVRAPQLDHPAAPNDASLRQG